MTDDLPGGGGGIPSRSKRDPGTVRLGGMALRNGLLVHSLDHWAAAVRTRDGRVAVASGRKPELPSPLVAVPGVRGVVRMAEVVYLLPLIRRRLPEARLPFEGVSAGATLAASAMLSRLLRRSGMRPLAMETLSAGLSLAPALASLRGSQVAGYHGAEHKAIGAYEQGTEPRDAAKEHERCGSHMVGPMLAATAVGNVLVSRLPASRRGPARAVAGLAAVGIAAETLGWMARHRDDRMARALRRPGYELQRLAATREPTEPEMDVARAALDEILRLESCQ